MEKEIKTYSLDLHLKGKPEHTKELFWTKSVLGEAPPEETGGAAQAVLDPLAIPAADDPNYAAVQQLLQQLIAAQGELKTIVAKKEDIRFFIWTPTKHQDLIEKQVHGAYPDAEIRVIDEYNISIIRY